MDITDPRYLDGRERMMATFFIGYVSRSPEELLGTEYAGEATIRRRMTAAVVEPGSSPSSSSAAAPSPPMASHAPYLTGSARGTRARSRSRGVIRSEAPERAAPYVPYRAPPAAMPPRASGTSRPAGACTAAKTAPSRTLLHEPPLQDRHPDASVSRASRPADTPPWRPSLPPPPVQFDAATRLAQQAAELEEEERLAMLRMRREQFAVERVPLGVGSASSSSAPAAPKVDLWANYQGVRRRPAASPGGKGAGKGHSLYEATEPGMHPKGGGKPGGKPGRGKGGGGRRGGQ